MRKIFGRDPVLIASFIEALILFLTTTVLDWSPDQIAGVNAVVTAALSVYVAWGLQPGDAVAGVVQQLVKAVISLAILFGAHITANQTGSILLVVSALAGLLLRHQVSAVVTKNDFATAA